MRKANVSLPFVESLLEDEEVPNYGLLGRMILRFSRERRAILDTIKTDTFEQLDQLDKKFGTNDRGGVMVASSLDDTLPKLIIAPLPTMGDKHGLTFIDEKSNQLCVVRSTPEDEEPQYALHVGGQRIEFDRLPLDQREKTLVALNAVAAAMNEEENQGSLQVKAGVF